MKKKILYFFTFVFIFFILPALLTNTKTNKQTKENEITTQANKEETNYEYKNNGTINLLHIKTGEIEQVKIDDYLQNVVSAEMPADYEIEALKAQAIVARTYTVYKIENKKHDNADICDNFACCQAWISKEDRLAKWEESKSESNWQKITECVNQTKGKIIIYNNKPINAFFHSNSGGTTEVPVNVWGGGEEYKYLQTVETAGEEGYTQYGSEVSFTNEELLEKLKIKYKDISVNFEDNEEIKIIQYTQSERVKTVKIGNHQFSGVEIRTLLNLKSANFEITKQNNNIKFSVKGYGHGVGMSQTGANTMAKQGKNCEEIIKHFYVGVELKNI